MISLIIAIVLLGIAGYIYFTQPATTDQVDTFESQSVDTTVWPDVNSFNLAKMTFEAKDLNTRENILVETNSSTKYYKIVNVKPEPSDYFDFQGFYSLMKNWEGPTWRFTLKGIAQENGSVLASEIYYTIQ